MRGKRQGTKPKEGLQKRTETLKGLAEQRAELVQQLKELVDTAETEKRAFSEEENRKFDQTEERIKKIDETLKRMERARGIPERKPADGGKKTDETQEQKEERAFETYIRAETQGESTDVNMTKGSNGAVIPSTIVNKIIRKVHDICPVYQMATKYDIGGTISIPYYDEETSSITMTYASEFEELAGTSGKFGSIELGGFLAGALSKISKSLINNSQFAIVPFVVNAMAESISRWIEKEMLNGTENKIEGMSKLKHFVMAEKENAVTADELIDLQEAVPDAFQAGAVWIMNKKTRTSIRKLKDSDGNYILNKDATSKWGYTLFGKDVYTSENMPEMTAGRMAIYYGDMSGLAVKTSESASIEILREKYATQHAVGVVAWLEMDAKIENDQKLAGLKMAAGA